MIGLVTVQCRDGFDSYQSNNGNIFTENYNSTTTTTSSSSGGIAGGNGSNVFITLVESQKTKQGVSLCKRTLTYLKSLCIGSHWIVDAASWLTECLSKGYAVKPDTYEVSLFSTFFSIIFLY